MTRQEKQQLLIDMCRIRDIIKNDNDMKFRWLNHPNTPPLTPMTLIHRSIRTIKNRIKPK